MESKIALPAQQRESVGFFLDCLRVLGSCKAEPSGSVSARPLLSRRTEPGIMIHCHFGVGEDLRVPWTVRRSTQSILKEINPEYSFIGVTDAEAEAPTLWPPDTTS